MRHRAYGIIGLVLLLGLSGLVASCTGPDTTREERPARPYRIQIHMTPEKEEADQFLAQVHAWWNELPDAERPAPLAASGLQPDIVWQQPYYRVRIGHFSTRQAAERALSAVRERFSNAFIARARVPAARR